MRYLFLNKHSNSTKHSKAAILKFLGSHHIESCFCLGLQAKRIKSNVAGVVAIEEARTECTVRVVGSLRQGLGNTEINNEKKKESEIRVIFVL
jgi:hypothetical protein